MNGTDQEYRSSEDSRRRRIARWLATSRTTGATAAVVCVILAVIVIAAVGIAVTRDDDPARSSPPASSVPVTTPAAEPGKDAAFGVPSSDLFGRVVAHPVNPRGQALPQVTVDRPVFAAGGEVAKPEGVMWQQTGPFVLPFSTSDGPARVDGPLVAGYTRTPQGAALAAWQMSMRLVIDPESLDAVFENQIEPSTRGSKALWAPKKWLDWSQYPAQYRPDAFRIAGWDADSSFAVVEYAARDKTAASWFTMRFEVVWHDGDWKLRRPTTSIPPQTITTLAGWTQW